MSLTSTQIYYLRRWLQQQTNSLLIEEINLLITHDLLLLNRIKALLPSQQQQLATLVNIHQDLQKNRQAITSLQNLESQILGLLQIQKKSAIKELLPTQADLETWLGTFNEATLVAQRYLGKVIVRNYWRGAKPISAWLADFEVGDSGYITYKPSFAPGQHSHLHPDQESYLKQWLANFINQCHRVLPKFPQMLMDAMATD
ncbi:hypothetical protein [Synechococcus sp. PCC 6312]|uniref:hypothetical protein n=1 Tax=Synechococcus sp. (strain ATCC 27167 / PCC 6312) TaxID=195253 RepID=UPI00029EE3F9|nr:hypothetical protein [Synechococcus sp. PCC 6312]AFY59733.1 hypothetical protein Syn6312_0506 [Synechococcus sp. PCC 6312]